MPGHNLAYLFFFLLGYVLPNIPCDVDALHRDHLMLTYDPKTNKQQKTKRRARCLRFPQLLVHGVNVYMAKVVY